MIVAWVIFRLAAVFRGETSASLPRFLDAPFDPKRDHFLGDPNAPYVLVEYGDYECPYCGRATGMIRELRDLMGDEMVYVYRHLALVDGPEQAALVVNLVAPEHAEVMAAPEATATLVERLRHAGVVFVGPWAPASVGDYVAGPSHVLPTAGTARFGSALTVSDFTKDVHVVTLDREALAAVGPHVAVLARAEGLPAHAESVTRRLERS